MKAERIRQFRFAGRNVSALFVLLSVMFYVCEVASIEIPPESEKKAVSLKKSYADAERSFAAKCGKCHKAPDPAKMVSVNHSCSSGLSKDALGQIRDYMTNVRAGKDLYETYCNRCHALIQPESHTFEYWSKNICTSDSCMVKKRLNSDEEQQLLLYLTSHAKKN